MEVSAPKKTSRYVDVDKQTTDLHNTVANESTKAGHLTTAAEVNPEDHTPFNNIKEIFGDAAHVVGTAGTFLGVEEPSTHVRTTHGGKVISLMQERARRLFHRRKAA